MIRVVLAVLVAVALVATAAPALEDARTTTTAERLDTEADRVERAVGDLVAGSVGVADPALAARTTLTVRAPGGFAAASIERLALVETDAPAGTSGQRGGPAVNEANAASARTAAAVGGATVALRYRIDGGPERTLPIALGGVAAAVAVDGGRLTLRPGGESRLRLRLIDDGGPTVRIARVG